MENNAAAFTVIVDYPQSPFPLVCLDYVILPGVFSFYYGLGNAMATKTSTVLGLID